MAFNFQYFRQIICVTGFVSSLVMAQMPQQGANPPFMMGSMPAGNMGMQQGQQQFTQPYLPGEQPAAMTTGTTSCVLDRNGNSRLVNSGGQPTMAPAGH